MKSAFADLRNHPQNPILIIDRAGLVGEPLSLKLSKEFLVVFASRKKINPDKKNNNLTHVPFFGKFPSIPDGKYSHIVLVDEAAQDLEILPTIVDKVRALNSSLIFAQGLSLMGEYSVNKVLGLWPSAKVVLFGDIFDHKLILTREGLNSTINTFIYQAQKFGRIQILGEGLRETHPVFLGDVVDGLVDIVFGIHRASSLLYAFPKYPPSELSLAHMIQKSNPEVVIDFVRHDSRMKNISYPAGGQYLLSDKYPLAKKIRGIDIKQKVRVRDIYVGRSKEKVNKFPAFMIATLIFLFFSPLIFTMLFSFLGLRTFYYAKGEIDGGNFSNAKSSIHLSQTFFSLGKQTSAILFQQGKIFGFGDRLSKLSEEINYGYKISQSLSQIFNSEIYFSKILTGKSENPANDLIMGESALNDSIVALNKIKAEGKIPAQISQNLEIINPLIKFLSTTSDVMPGLLGMGSPKTYLVLFQNNLELRPGGGFIGSYGILKLKMGKITQFAVYDVYDADEKLRGHVEPPFAIRRYLPSEHWHLRDSNFDVDFVKSALSASNFVSIETGEKVDGVLAVDVSFIRNVLHALGPIYVSDYGELVNENNLYALSQSYPEKNFFPGYTQKKDFLRSLNNEISTRLTEDNTPYLLIAQAISDALSQKHLLFAFDNNSQKIFSVNGWSSVLEDQRTSSEENINDFLGINEANLGTNKVDYLISRQVSQKVVIANDGSLAEELAIYFKNDSLFLPGGNYKNYLRVILPKNTNLSEISINDSPQKIVSAIIDPLVYEAKTFKAPEGLEVEKVEEENKQIFGFIVDVPADKSVTVKLKYSFPGNVSNLGVFSYNLELFKQPGIDSLPYSLSFSYPKTLNIVKSFDKLGGVDGIASHSENLVKDKNLIINFAKR